MSIVLVVAVIVGVADVEAVAVVVAHFALRSSQPPSVIALGWSWHTACASSVGNVDTVWRRF